MPLLLCPACTTNAAMTAVQRNGVEFDVCTTCRGVWLDRGELEKLLETSRGERQERAAFDRDRDEFYRDPDAYRRSHPSERRDDDPRRKKRGFDLFDIFD